MRNPPLAKVVRTSPLRGLLREWRLRGNAVAAGSGSKRRLASKMEEPWVKEAIGAAPGLFEKKTQPAVAHLLP